MKKIFLIGCMLSFAFAVNAQVNPDVRKDTIKVDTTQLEKIQKMPMDTTHLRMEKMPNAVDSAMNKKNIDDKDPQKKD